MVLTSPSSVVCSYIPFHLVLNKLILDERTVLLFGWDVEHEQRLFVDAEVLQLYS